MPVKYSPVSWGASPWKIKFTSSNPRPDLPRVADYVVVGAGFTGLAAAAWLRRLAPNQSVVVLESHRLGAGASGRTGGMALAETAAGDQAGLGDVLAGFRNILETLEVDCDLDLCGAWEIARTKPENSARLRSPIDWQDSGTLRVVNRVPGGTIDPSQLVSGLARAASRSGAQIFENHRVVRVNWRKTPEVEIALGPRRTARITAGQILFATNALSLSITGLHKQMHPRLTLAILTAPLSERVLEDIGLAGRHPFYTLDFPYLWGRVLPNRSVIFGAGLVHSPDANDLEAVNVRNGESAEMLARLQERVRHLHPALKQVKFTHRWGGPILFRDSWKPVFDWHPRSAGAKNAIVSGAYAGHGVALSSYLGKWAAEVLTEQGPKLPRWGQIDS
ncbi:MAG TPA: FAD-dependent oxidoreductase [Candidatus Acidoferrales bacterium]